MKLSELKEHLAGDPQKSIRFILPTGSKIPPHAHVTEVARVDKRFIDCGGTFRTDSICRLQTWFADDTAHRLTAGKLLGILNKSASLLESESLDVDIEHEAPFISQFPIASVEIDDSVVVLHLGTRHTACLAEDKCGVATPDQRSLSLKPLPSFQQSQCCSGAC